MLGQLRKDKPALSVRAQQMRLMRCDRGLFWQMQLTKLTGNVLLRVQKVTLADVGICQRVQRWASSCARNLSGSNSMMRKLSVNRWTLNSPNDSCLWHFSHSLVPALHYLSLICLASEASSGRFLRPSDVSLIRCSCAARDCRCQFVTEWVSKMAMPYFRCNYLRQNKSSNSSLAFIWRCWKRGMLDCIWKDRHLIMNTPQPSFWTFSNAHHVPLCTGLCIYYLALHSIFSVY